MISNAFIAIALYIVNLVLSIFPSSAGFPASFDTAITQVSGYIGIFSPIFPINTMATILGLVIAFEIAVFTFNGLKWIFSYVPLIGGRG